VVNHGEYFYFRCATHRVEGAIRESPWADYKCSVRGCERPARCYWYRGHQFADLPVAMVVDTIDYDNFLP